MTFLNGVDQAAVRKNIGEFSDDTPIPFNASTATLLAYGNMGYQHVHNPCRVYPTRVDPVLITAANGAWAAFPAPTEIIPANTITTAYDIHWAIVSNLSETDYYEMKIYGGAGGSEAEIAHIAFSKTAVFIQEGNLPVQVPRIAANTRISAAISCGTALATCRVKFYYHEYS